MTALVILGALFARVNIATRPLWRWLQRRPVRVTLTLLASLAGAIWLDPLCAFGFLTSYTADSNSLDTDGNLQATLVTAQFDRCLHRTGGTRKGMLCNYGFRAALSAPTATTIGFSASTHLTALPIVLIRDGGVLVRLSAIPSPVTLSGGLGTKYIYLDPGSKDAEGWSTTGTLVSSTTAPNLEGTTDRIPLGEVGWSGTAITSVSSYHPDVVSIASPKQAQMARDLVARTHLDIDKAAAQVWFAADAIVMDDGTLLEGWGPIAVNLATTGENGRDAGSESASTWYELWAIAKADGTKAGVLHQALDYFQDELYNSGEDGSHMLRRATAPVNTKLTQSFKVDTAGPCPFIDAKLVRLGAVAAGKAVWFELQTDDGSGKPSGTILATSDKLDASLISTTATVIRFMFRRPTTLAAATTYHLVLAGDYTASDTVNIQWRADTTAATYANGSKGFFDNTNWTMDTDDDFIFWVYITRNDTAVTMPTGYTKKQRIAIFRNDGSSNLIPQVQFGRRALPLKQQSPGTFTATIATLTDLSAFVPPGRLRLVLAGNNSTASAFVGAAPIPDGYAMVGSALINRDGGGASVAVAPTATSQKGVTTDVVETEAQAIYVAVSSGTGEWLLTSWERD
jgi:hypothetical protein